MLALKFHLCAAKVLHDQKTGMASAVDIVGAVYVGAFPVRIRELAYLACIERSADEAEAVEVELCVLYHGLTLRSESYRLDFGAGPRIYLSVPLSTIHVSSPGELGIRLGYAGGVLGEYSVTIAQALPSETT